jgi:hypothetical protein
VQVEFGDGEHARDSAARATLRSVKRSFVMHRAPGR